MSNVDNKLPLQKMSRRRAILTGAGTALAGIAGCTGTKSNDDGTTQSGDSSGESEPVTIKHWNSETQAPRREVVNGIIQSWEQDSGNSVDITYMQETDMKTNIQTARTTGDFPSAIWATKVIMNQIASSGLNADAGDVISSIGEDKFYDRMLELSKAPGGGYAAIPIGTSAFNMYYNEKRFDEEGLKPPQTWDAILKAAETFHDPDNDKYGIVLMNTADKDGSRALSQFALSNDAHVLNEKEEVVFDSPEMIETLEFLSELFQYSPDFHPTWEDSEKFYANGKTNMFWMSAYIPVHPYVEKDMADVTRFGHYIEKERKVSYTPPKMMTLLGEDANHPEAQISAGKDFTEFWLSGDAYEDTMTMIPGALMPTIKGYEDAVLNTDLFSEDNWGSQIAKDQLAAVQYGDEMGVVNGTPVPALGKIQANNLIGEACFRLAEGDNPDTVAKEQAKKMREVLQ